MKAYQVRLIKEFEDLYIRTHKLHNFIKSIDADNYNYATPSELLMEQLDVMTRYLDILIERFKYEDMLDEVPFEHIIDKMHEFVKHTKNEEVTK